MPLFTCNIVYQLNHVENSRMMLFTFSFVFYVANKVKFNNKVISNYIQI